MRPGKDGGWKGFRVLALVALFASGAEAAMLSVPFPPETDGGSGEEGREAPVGLALQLEYRIACRPGAAFRGMTGLVRLPDRALRVDLFAVRDRAEIDLGTYSPEERRRLASGPPLLLELDPEQECSPETLTARIHAEEVSAGAAGEVAALARLHSPFLTVRTDQREDRVTDPPLALVYRWLGERDGGGTLEYIYVFSDEDSVQSSLGTKSEMGNYGRTTDIEWAYRVRFDGARRVVRREYQSTARIGGLDLGFSHGTRRFRGKFVTGEGSHPILYNRRKNNVFTDKGDGSGREGYHLVPRMRLAPDEALERVMLENPWMYAVSYDEQRREGKAPERISDYLFVWIDGEMEVGGWKRFWVMSGALKAKFKVEFADGSRTEALSGGGLSGMSRGLDDRWLRRSLVTAAPIGSRALDAIVEGRAQGELEFKRVPWIVSPKLKVKSIRLFRLVEVGDLRSGDQVLVGLPRTVEITPFFDCQLKGLRSRCTSRPPIFQ